MATGRPASAAQNAALNASTRRAAETSAWTVKRSASERCCLCSDESSTDHGGCRANLALRSRVKELEARLNAAGLASQNVDTSATPFYPNAVDREQSPAQMSHGAPSDAGSRATAHTPESSADAIATGLFDHPPVVDIGYFGKDRASCIMLRSYKD